MTETVLDAALLKDFPLPNHPEDSGKEDRGRLLAIAGSRELVGAALLAGTAALRVGAGKLQVATGESVALALGVALPEARVIGHQEFAEHWGGLIDIDNSDDRSQTATRICDHVLDVESEDQIAVRGDATLVPRVT